MQIENKWQDRFDDRYYDENTPSGLTQKFKYYKFLVDDIRNNFIQSEIDTAIAEERSKIILELEKCKEDENIWDYIYALKRKI